MKRTRMMKITVLAGFVGLSLLMGSQTTARADTLFGEFQRLPHTIERGFSIGFDVGIVNLIRASRSSVTNPGFYLGFTLGYDLFDYLSIEMINQVGINQADPNDPALQGGVNLYNFALAPKLQYPLGRFYPFVEAGAGICFTKPDFDPGQDTRYKLGILAGAGFEYYTYLRHFSLLVKITYTYVNLPFDVMTFGAGMKYTF